MTRTLRLGRTTVARGGYGVQRQLRAVVNAPDVFWSAGGNSYVVTTDGALLSINGIGEIRWTVEPWNTDADSAAARAYFFAPEEVQS